MKNGVKQDVIALLDALDQWYRAGDSGPSAYALILENDVALHEKIKQLLVTLKPEVRP
jgi:hypothetical protein